MRRPNVLNLDLIAMTMPRRDFFYMSTYSRQPELTATAILGPFTWVSY